MSRWTAKCTVNIYIILENTCFLTHTSVPTLNQQNKLMLPSRQKMLDQHWNNADCVVSMLIPHILPAVLYFSYLFYNALCMSRILLPHWSLDAHWMQFSMVVYKPNTLKIQFHYNLHVYVDILNESNWIFVVPMVMYFFFQFCLLMNSMWNCWRIPSIRHHFRSELNKLKFVQLAVIGYYKEYVSLHFQQTVFVVATH